LVGFFPFIVMAIVIAGADIRFIMIAIEAMHSTTPAETVAKGAEGGSCADSIVVEVRPQNSDGKVPRRRRSWLQFLRWLLWGGWVFFAVGRHECRSSSSLLLGWPTSPPNQNLMNL
jgi:hypothetical protein